MECKFFHKIAVIHYFLIRFNLLQELDIIRLWSGSRSGTGPQATGCASLIILCDQECLRLGQRKATTGYLSQIKSASNPLELSDHYFFNSFSPFGGCRSRQSRCKNYP